MKNSASRKHKTIQALLLTVAENINCPAGWRVQAYPEWKEETYRPDVRLFFSHPRKGHYEVYCEVQKNRTEKSFVNKLDKYKHMMKMKEIDTYLVVWEDEVPDDSGKMWDYLENMIEMNVLPW